jgi:NAD-dependent deacetylase
MTLPEEALKAINEAAIIIEKSGYVIALTGAGVSVESNLRAFRGPGGLWTEKGEPPLNGYQLFQKDPKNYWERMLNPKKKSSFRESILNAKPNKGHFALAELEKIGILRTLITQNIDNLHLTAGNRNVLEIHGNSNFLRCIGCGNRWKRNDFVFNEVPPRCNKCGDIIKNDTVMFGEPIPAEVLNKCYEKSEKSDCMLFLGTSATVTPAANLPILIKRKGDKLIELNVRTSELSYLCDVNIIAPFGEAMPILVKEVKKNLSNRRNII